MTAVSARAMAPASFATLADLLRHRAAAHAGRPGLYRAVGSRAGAGAAHLRRTGRPLGATSRGGSRLAPSRATAPCSFCPNGIGFMVGFFACVLARVAAVPMMVPRRNSARDASAGIVADCTPRLALAPRALIGGERGDLAARFANAGHERLTGRSNFWRWTTPKAPRADPTARQAASPVPDDIAFLQYTSGSTSAPKGVMVSHANLLGQSGDDRAGLRQYAALDLCQLGAALSRHGPDHKRAAEPLCRRFLRADGAGRVHAAPAGLAAGDQRLPRRGRRRPQFRLRSVRRALPAGADGRDRPVLLEGRLQRRRAGARPRRSAASAETFAPHGFAASAMLPAYGMAEATVLVSAGAARRRPGDADRQPRSACAPARVAPPHDPADAQADRRLRPRARRRADRDRRSRQPDAARRRADRRDLGRRPECRARLLAEPGGERRGVRRARSPARRARRAGCAPAISAFSTTAGELFITGRIKDVVIIRGANHYPQDIEDTVQSAHPALRRHGGAAFAVQRRRTARSGWSSFRRSSAPSATGSTPTRSSAASARRSSASTRSCRIEIVLLRPGALPKTTSGKIQRALTRQLWLGGIA